jgi:hypothetical protein
VELTTPPSGKRGANRVKN